MAQTIQFRRGNEANLPSLAPGEPAVTLDTQDLFIGSPSGNIKLSKKDDVTVSVKHFGAKGDGVNNDTTAIQNALDSGAGVILVPKGTYKITSPLAIPSNTTLLGVGRRNSIIVQHTNGVAIIEIGSGQFKGVKGLTLKYNTWQVDPNAKGIGKNTNDPVGQSVFQELEIEGAYDGIYSPNQFYSNTVSDLWIHSYSHAAMYLEGTGSTGCVFNNIYTTNWNDYLNATKNQATFAFFFQGFSESFATQLNVEHSRLSYGIYLNAVDNFKLSSTHVEGYEQRGDDYSGIIGIQNSQVDIDGLTVGFSWKEVGATLTNINLFALKGNAKLTAKNVVTRDNSIVWGVQRPTAGISTNLVFSGDYTSSATLENHTSEDGYFTIYPAFSVNNLPPIVLKHNNNVFYEEKGGKKVVTSATLPTSGVWKKGDEVINPNAVVGSYSKWRCVQDGTFGATPPVFGGIGKIETI